MNLEQKFKTVVNEVNIMNPNIDMIKHLYLRLIVQDGEREHTHHCIHVTKCKDIKFSALWYTAHYWGIGEHEHSYLKNYPIVSQLTKEPVWWFDNEITVRLESYKEITEIEYQFLNKLFYGG